MMNKFLHQFILLFLVMSIFCRCSNISSYQKEIYNDNAKIINQGDSYTFLNRVGDIKDNNLKIVYSGFYGMETIWEVESEGKGTVTIKFDSKVDKGKFKLVFITPENKVINVFEQSGKGEKTIQTEKGKSRIKIVGNNAKGQIEINIKTSGYAMLKKIQNIF
ncbi:hypothetical protein SAMN02745195_01155 [Thermoanaerobacter uzonensis DSM 18761]|uniref:Uncharacterized protein n=1 Tax=Thermoanaerobacter uzonensis DSM 18761 TaxID=1123369 RepID=A0A1M4WGJ7_9THEO|nr:hypothetical protein [Thermoanaerobacter uzonensis]SHE80315.1 hypothetical protein SAMN02745195_01155 [Thermoanaerobacter uzonensis DSM 18761]